MISAMVSATNGLQRRLFGALLQAPPAALRLVAGHPRVSDEGVDLDPSVQTLLRGRAWTGMDPMSLPDPFRLAALRASTHWFGLVFGPGPERSVSVEERTLALVGRARTLRCYRPRRAGPSRLPLVLFLHGGGFTVGSLASYDALCRLLSHRAGCVVAALDYRLAPEHPFPAGLNDCVDTMAWLGDHAAELGADPGRVAVCGDSAGGNLAAVICLLAREPAWQGPRPCFQLLIYPATDLTCSLASHETFSRGLVLTREMLDYFVRCYVPRDHDLRDPRISPLFVEDLSGVAPALIYTAGFDALRDEGRAYAQRLRQAGVQVAHRELGDQIHGFFNLAGVVPRAAHAVEQMAAELRQALADPG